MASRLFLLLLLREVWPPRSMQSSFGGVFFVSLLEPTCASCFAREWNVSVGLHPRALPCRRKRHKKSMCDCLRRRACVGLLPLPSSDNFDSFRVESSLVWGCIVVV
eukprot:1871560-Amphidinium_carterae.1